MQERSFAQDSRWAFAGSRWKRTPCAVSPEQFRCKITCRGGSATGPHGEWCFAPDPRWWTVAAYAKWDRLLTDGVVGPGPSVSVEPVLERIPSNGSRPVEQHDLSSPIAKRARGALTVKSGSGSNIT